MQRNPTGDPTSDDGAPDDREPDDGDLMIGKGHVLDDDDGEEDAEDREYRVARRANPLPIREEEEEELSEADIMEELDADDLKKMEGPDS